MQKVAVIASCMRLIQGLVIREAFGLPENNRRQSRLHQIQIHEQARGTSIAVDKRVIFYEVRVQARGAFQGMAVESMMRNK